MGTPKARTSGIMFQVMPPATTTPPTGGNFLVTITSSDFLVTISSSNNLVTA